MNRGDTSYLMLNYTFNGNPLEENAYQEIELQLNKQSNYKSVRKTYTNGDIQWGTLTYEVDGTEQTFTGYYCRLTQEETFALNEGTINAQLRVLLNDEVGSSPISSFELGQVLSEKVLSDTTE